MDSSSNSQPDANTPADGLAESIAFKPCPICAEQIRFAAKKCVHCSSDLSWRGFVGISNSTLALLTALVAVVSTTVPSLKQALYGNRSDLSVFYVGLSQGAFVHGRPTRRAVNLQVRNNGNLSNSIIRAHIRIAWDSGKRPASENDLIKAEVNLSFPNQTPVLIPAGSINTVKLAVEDSLVFTQITTEGKNQLLNRMRGPSSLGGLYWILETRCSIFLMTNDADNNLDDQWIPIRCADLDSMLKSALERHSI